MYALRYPPGRALAPLLLTGLLALVPGLSLAGAKGSLHDFSGLGFVPGGACSACHLAHGGQNERLWPRLLTEENQLFDQRSGPDYAPSPTVLCYDCHVDQSVPAGGQPGGWSVSEVPQDIALGGSAVGYYELADGSVPTVGGPTDGSPTGGHYWKSEPGGTPDYGKGDKIPCTLCHDPHDSDTGGNEVMFREFTFDGGGGTVDLTTYGTDLRASPSSRNGSGTGREMCAACHAFSDDGTPVTLWNVSVPRPPSSMPDHASAGSGPCVDCHRHNFVTPSGGCETCHGQGGNVHSGLDGIPGNADDAPNVISVDSLSVWDGTWWNTVKGGSASVQQGGHGDPGGKPALECTDCHDTKLPTGTHMDGVVNSAENGTNPNENTAHLKASFIGTSSPDSDVQVTLDNACWDCHSAQGVKSMDHDSESRGSDPPGPVQFGRSLTILDGTALPYPIDSDISTNKSTAQPNFAPCVSCHNPHGTTTAETKNNNPNKSNFMMREGWTPKAFCLRCHQ